MAHGKHLQAYLDANARFGSEFTLMRTPEAAAAQQADEQAESGRQSNLSTDAWLQANPSLLQTGFTSKEQRSKAYGSELYKTSKSYRQAVHAITAKTSNEIMGLAKQESVSPEGMLEAAEQAAYTARRNDLFHKGNSHDPVIASQAQLDLINFERDPANKAIMEKYERTVAETRPIETHLRAMKAAGQRVGTHTLSGEPSDASDADRESIAAYPYGMSRVGGGGEGDGE
jgi:hypothetical protein